MSGAFISRVVEHVKPDAVNSRCSTLGHWHRFLVHVAGVHFGALSRRL